MKVVRIISDINKDHYTNQFQYKLDYILHLKETEEQYYYLEKISTMNNNDNKFYHNRKRLVKKIKKKIKC